MAPSLEGGPRIICGNQINKFAAARRAGNGNKRMNWQCGAGTAPPPPPPTRLPRRRRQAAPPDPPPPGLFPQPSSCTQLDPSSRPKFKLQASLFSAAYRTGPLYWRRGRRQVLNRALPGLAAGVRLFFHFGGPLGGSPGRRYPGPHHFGARAPVNLYIGGRGGF